MDLTKWRNVPTCCDVPRRNTAATVAARVVTFFVRQNSAAQLPAEDYGAPPEECQYMLVKVLLQAESIIEIGPTSSPPPRS